VFNQVTYQKTLLCAWGRRGHRRTFPKFISLALLSHLYFGAPCIHFNKRDRSKHATGGDIASGLDGVD
jgi:hypothetical protein